MIMWTHLKDHGVESDSTILQQACRVKKESKVGRMHASQRYKPYLATQKRAAVSEIYRPYLATQ